MTPDKQERLRALSEEMRAGLDGVTPGPWGFEDDVNPHLVTAGQDADGAYLYVDSDVDVRHIARCSPDNIRLLLDAATFLQQELAEARALARQQAEEIGKLRGVLEWYADLPAEWTINAGAGMTYGNLYLLGEKARAALSKEEQPCKS